MTFGSQISDEVRFHIISIRIHSDPHVLFLFQIRLGFKIRSGLVQLPTQFL